MVARGSHRRRQAAEQRSAVMFYGASLTMHQVLGANHLASECRADGLVSQADAQDWHFSCQLANQLDADAGLTRCTWPWRNDDLLGLHFSDFTHADLVVAANFHLRAQLR